nr:glyoxalase [uncultured Vagococcus sp.]
MIDHFGINVSSFEKSKAFYQTVSVTLDCELQHDSGVAGGTHNAAPGLRSQYHPNYHGPFVYDPDGYHIEAVYHGE